MPGGFSAKEHQRNFSRIIGAGDLSYIATVLQSIKQLAISDRTCYNQRKRDVTHAP